MQSTYTCGVTYFELSNHLGNPDSGSGQAVLTVVTDRKGVTNNLQYNSAGLPETTLSESIKAALSIKDLYNRFSTDLTGDKFLLKPNSEAPKEMLIQKINAKQFNQVPVSINLPLIITQTATQVSSQNKEERKVNFIRRIFYKIFNPDEDEIL